MHSGGSRTIRDGGVSTIRNGRRTTRIGTTTVTTTITINGTTGAGGSRTILTFGTNGTVDRAVETLADTWDGIMDTARTKIC
jgi:hypothetical protein